MGRKQYEMNGIHQLCHVCLGRTVMMDFTVTIILSKGWTLPMWNTDERRNLISEDCFANGSLRLPAIFPLLGETCL